MGVYSRLQRLAANDPEAVAQAIKGKNQQLFNLVVKVMACRDGKFNLPPGRVSAILAAGIDALEPLPELSGADLHLQNVERRRDNRKFLNAEEVYLGNRRPGLFEAIQEASLAQGLGEAEIVWIRCAVAVISRAARLQRRSARQNRAVPRRRAPL